VAGSCEYGDEPKGSGATKLVIKFWWQKDCADKNIVGPSGRAALGVGLDRSDTETVGSNPAYGMGVCRLFIIIYLSPYHQRI
jgi:hypothetical protein